MKNGERALKCIFLVINSKKFAPRPPQTYSAGKKINLRKGGIGPNAQFISLESGKTYLR